MKTQYRIINVGKGLLNLQPTNLNKVEQPYIEDLAAIGYVDAQDALKADKLATYTKTETDSFITQLLGGAPADGNTLKELNDKILAVQAIIGSADPDANLLVDTVKELLAVFSTFPEGIDLVNLLAGKVNTTDIYNALNSVVAGKVLDARQGKVLKDLIDALAITVSNISSNVVTTIKPILSTALASQNVAGFVTYINALNPVLVVGTSEIVKYNLTDTGRVFELNVRGRSFGVGQPAIVAVDVLEVTDFLNKDIRLSNYPSTRNDGQLPTNKVLAPDINGNIKLYTIATAPAPYLEVLVPDSTLPSVTTNFTLKGAFFTPTMTVAIAGQTINYITFKSDNLVLVNVTTGATEGSYAVTLNNGIQAVFPNALLIVLGTVFMPTNSQWIDIVEPIIINNDQVLVKTFGSSGTAVWNKVFDKTKNYRIIFKMKASQMGISPLYANYMIKMVSLVLASDRLTNRFSVEHWVDSTRTYYRALSYWRNLVYSERSYEYNGGSDAENYSDFDKTIVEFRFQSGVLTLWARGELQATLSTSVTEDFMLKVQTKYLDIADIKYIELAS